MPELAEVEIIKRQLEVAITKGSAIEDVPICSPKFGQISQSLLALPLKIDYIHRKGKFLLVYLSGLEPRELIIHLGMTGQLRIVDGVPLDYPKHTRFCMVFRQEETGKVYSLLFIDPRQFGKVPLVTPGVYTGLLSVLGPDVYEQKHPIELVRNSRKSIKAILLDQRFMAGIGNYLADETLFEAGIRPTRQGLHITEQEALRIVAAARTVASRALLAGGLSFSDYTQLDGSQGNFQTHLRVYGRSGEVCQRCGTALTTIVLAGRTTVFCEECQR
jgi:formamidopyrimidine-DNA glycosylase